jgi:hypothetical protein
LHGSLRGGRWASLYQRVPLSSRLAPCSLSWSRKSSLHNGWWFAALKKHSIVYRLGTKVLQCPTVEVIQEAMEFQQFIRPMLLGPECDLHFIINMDQIPVYFWMHPTRMLEVLGKITVAIRTTLSDTKHATVALTITACYHCAYNHGSR